MFLLRWFVGGCSLFGRRKKFFCPVVLVFILNSVSKRLLLTFINVWGLGMSL